MRTKLNPRNLLLSAIMASMTLLTGCGYTRGYAGIENGQYIGPGYLESSYYVSTDSHHHHHHKPPKPPKHKKHKHKKHKKDKHHKKHDKKHYKKHHKKHHHD